MGKRKVKIIKAKDGVESTGPPTTSTGPPTTRQERTTDGATIATKILLKKKSQERKSLKTNRALIFGIPAAAVLVVSAAIFHWYNVKLVNYVRTPLDAPKLVVKNWTADDANKFWGSYRSNLYFGLKARSPSSPVFGLMWMTQFISQNSPAIRHWCDQSDGLQKYGWLAHDGINFGVQEIVDQHFNMSTWFVKRPGGLHGGDWSAKIRLQPQSGNEKVAVSLFIYMATDGQGQVAGNLAGDRVAGIRGRSDSLGSFQLLFPKLDKSVKYNYLVSFVPGLDQLKEVLLNGLRYFQLSKEANTNFVGLVGKNLPEGMQESQANFIVSQVTVTLPYELEVAFESDSFSGRQERMIGEIFQAEFSKHFHAFEKRFEDVFPLKDKGYDEEHVKFAKAALSNMLGGMGYFYGSSIVQSQHTPNPIAYWEAPLYTAVPSRSFFPRGFLWDEGFHNVLISRWNLQISVDIIGHWFDLLNIEGWIPREQILGLEAKAKVPQEFVVQRNEYANPPTFFLPLKNIVKELAKSDDVRDHQFLERLFPRLKAWYNWFNQTQSGPVSSSYQWRGRNATSALELNPKTLTSGLDDYPRASHPTSDERHLDLRCWMALASDVMTDIAKSINESWAGYERQYLLLTDNELLDKLHWSDKMQRYSDYGLHTDHVKLERPPQSKNLQHGQRPPPNQPREKQRAVKQEPLLQFVDSEFGYVSLFPFLLKIIRPDSPKLNTILRDLKDPSLLWTPFGLRSLAKSSPMYNKHNTEHDPPYWRGAIWVNINYLALDALHYFAHIPGPYQVTAGSIYQELRTNLVENIFSQYQKTGYIWEQYDDVTGNGKGSHPFTGWSSLVVSIMAEKY